MLDAIFSGLLGLFLTALVLGVCWVWFLGPIIKWLFASSKSMTKAVGKTFDLGTSIGTKLVNVNKNVVVVEPEGIVNEPAVFFDAISAPNYQIAKWVKSYPVKKLGYVLFRGYEKHLERCLVIEGNTAVQKIHGRRIQLANLEGMFIPEDRHVVEKTIEEVTKLVESSISKIESRSSAPKAVNIKEPAIVPSQVQTLTPVVVESSPVQAAIPAAAKKDKALEAYKGYLISYGKAVRHMSKSKDDTTGDESGKEIEQFRVVIRSEDGIEESIWGADLLRAIKDANVAVNDMVEVIKMGKRQFGTTWKNLYAITKLA